MAPHIQQIVDGSLAKEELHTPVKPIVPIVHAQPEQLVDASKIANGVGTMISGIGTGVGSIISGAFSEELHEEPQQLADQKQKNPIMDVVHSIGHGVSAIIPMEEELDEKKRNPLMDVVHSIGHGVSAIVPMEEELHAKPQHLSESHKEVITDALIKANE